MLVDLNIKFLEPTGMLLSIFRVNIGKLYAAK
jgi:hypothetical protein